METSESESPDSAHVRVHHRGQAVGDGDARQAPAHGEVQRVQGGLPAAPVDFGPVEFRGCGQDLANPVDSGCAGLTAKPSQGTCCCQPLSSSRGRSRFGNVPFKVKKAVPSLVTRCQTCGFLGTDSCPHLGGPAGQESPAEQLACLSKVWTGTLFFGLWGWLFFEGTPPSSGAQTLEPRAESRNRAPLLESYLAASWNPPGTTRNGTVPICRTCPGCSGPLRSPGGREHGMEESRPEHDPGVAPHVSIQKNHRGGCA